MKIWSFEKETPPSRCAQKIVFVGGCFDVLHYGHILFLKNAKKEGDYLIVALESDQFISFYKKRSPFHSQAQRAEILEALVMVDEIILLPLMKGFDDYLNLTRAIRPHVIAITAGDPQLHNKLKQAEFVSAKVVSVTSLIPNQSSSLLITSKCGI